MHLFSQVDTWIIRVWRWWWLSAEMCLPLLLLFINKPRWICSARCTDSCNLDVYWCLHPTWEKSDDFNDIIAGCEHFFSLLYQISVSCIKGKSTLLISASVPSVTMGKSRGQMHNQRIWDQKSCECTKIKTSICSTFPMFLKPCLCKTFVTIFTEKHLKKDTGLNWFSPEFNVPTHPIYFIFCCYSP